MSLSKCSIADYDLESTSLSFLILQPFLPPTTSKSYFLRDTIMHLPTATKPDTGWFEIIMCYEKFCLTVRTSVRYIL